MTETFGMQSQDDYQLELDLVSYREASLAEAGGQRLQYLYASTDKSRVTGMGMANTCFAKPSNKTWWAPPVVTSPILVCLDGPLHSALCNTRCVAQCDEKSCTVQSQKIVKCSKTQHLCNIRSCTVQRKRLHRATKTVALCDRKQLHCATEGALHRVRDARWESDAHVLL